MEFKILSPSFFKRKNTGLIARQLLGKILWTNIRGKLTGGIIVETEAYLGVEDRACHAYGGLKSKRNEALYMEGGTAYVHICYGIHTMFNISTGVKGVPHGVLIRGIKPVYGTEIMEKRRGTKIHLAVGPGNLTKALGIKMRHNKTRLNSLKNHGPEIFITYGGFRVCYENIIITPRVGIGYAGEWAKKPLRFMLKT